MTHNDRIDEMLSRWEELHRRGQEVSAAELCADRPEMADELRRRIRALRVINRPLESTRDTAPHRSEPMPEPDTRRQLGRYLLERFLARGGFGDACEAYDPELERAVAIKLLHEERRGTGDGHGMLRWPENHRSYLERGRDTHIPWQKCSRQHRLARHA
jgi:hypothetical protein